METDKSTEKFVCHDCENEFPKSDRITTAHGNYICQGCYDDNYFTCQDCGDIFHSDNANTIDDENYCPHCYSENHQSEDLPTRYYEVDDTYVSETRGSILHSLRKFGVELEVFTEDAEDRNDLARNLPKKIGVEHDGSISGSYGLEAQTPPASGVKAETLIKKICETMSEYHARVNNSCGFHLHIDVSDIDSRRDLYDYSARSFERAKLDKIKRLWLFYIAFEDVIQSFLPTNRRANGYCKPLKADYHYREIYNAESVEILERIWYRARTKADKDRKKENSKDETRYRGINMHTLFRDRHIEIRYHSGTTNWRKILEWTNLHLTIIDYIFNNGVNFGLLENMIAEIDVAKKTQKFFEVLRLPKESSDYFLVRQSTFWKPLTPQAIDETIRAEVVGGLTANDQ